MPPTMNRRSFHATAAGMGALAFAPNASAAPPSQRVRLGFIGLGNRGDQVLDAFLVHPDAEVVALCDVYEPYLEAAKAKVGSHARTCRDFRELIDQKDVDAVVISTPDHWHALQFVAACQAGKDVYVEKPLSLTIAEGQRMVAVAQETGRVTQMGVQRRSSPLVKEMIDLIQQGAIGKVTVAKCYHLANESPLGIGAPPDCDPPAGLDWDLWLGPAPTVPYNPNRCLYKFRWFYDYSGGQITNNGVHYLDLIQWALGQDAPRSVHAVGGKYFVRDNREVPDTMEVVWEYPGDTLVTFSQYNANAAAANARNADLEFRGTEGTMFLRGNQIEILPEMVRLEELPALSPLARTENRAQGKSRQPARKPLLREGDTGTELHTRNFLDCVKSRSATNCPVAVGHRSTIPTILANISLKLARRLVWDPQTERFANDHEANRLLGYEYRSPWRLG
jgi:predicted dehydrogenase